MTKQASIGTQVLEAKVTRLIEEEQELAKKDLAIKQLEQDTKDMLVTMAAAAEAGDEQLRRDIRNEIVVLNLRLVTRVLGKYGSFTSDKSQNGSIGLLKAVETFKAERGVPFRNYACFCIEMEIRAAWAKQKRTFEGRNEGFLDSLDAPSTLGNGDEADKHDMIDDPISMEDFNSFVDEQELHTLFYDIIIPSIQEYGVRSKDLDMKRWQELEIQYFMELSQESSQQQRLTFSQMADELGTVTQNIRTRHKKVLELAKKKAQHLGYEIVTTFGRARADGPGMSKKSEYTMGKQR